MFWLPLPLGIARRLYGADKGDFPFNRWLCYALPVGMSLFLAFPVGEWKLAYLVSLIVAAWGGMSLADYDNYWHLKSVKDWAMMALNGLAITLPISLPMLFHGPYFMILGLSGIIMPLGYFLGRYLPALPYLRGFTEWGELLGHMLIGSLMVLVWMIK